MELQAREDPVNRLVRLLASAFVVCSAVPDVSAVPVQFPYFGVLYATGGAPYEGTVDVTVTLHADPVTAGTDFWTHTYVSETIDEGLLALPIGGGGSPAIGAAALAVPEVWIEITIGTTTLSPRQRVLSVPYAIAAGDAETLGGVAPSGYATAGDALAILDELDALSDFRDNVLACAADSGLWNGTQCISVSAGGGGSTVDPFTVADVSDVEVSTLITSNLIVPVGFGVAVAASVSGDGSPELSVEGGSWGPVDSVAPGETLMVRMTSAPTGTTPLVVTIDLGGTTTDWTVTTGDAVPDAFSFAPVTDVGLGSVIASAPIVPTGLAITAPISVAGDGSPEIRVQGGAWMTSGSVAPGNSVEVRLTSASAVTTSRTATVTIGGVSADFVVTTGAVTALSCAEILSASPGSPSGEYTILANGTTVDVWCEMTFDGGGYTLLVSHDRTNNADFNTMTISTGDLADGQRLDPQVTNSVWNSATAEKRMLVRCKDGGIWGSAIANNWYAGGYTGGYRSNCGFSYGSTIDGYSGDSWYQQNGNGQCLHGSSTGMAATGTSASCSGLVQHLIR